MAITLGGLNDLTGLFPGATAAMAGLATEAQYKGPAIGAGDSDGYIAIPVQSIKFTGSNPNKWLIDHGGSGVQALPKVGDGISTDGSNNTSTGSFRNFMRGMHESAYNYTTGSLTGTNAFTYWQETAGSFSVSNATTLRRIYSTSLYYEIGDSTASKIST